MICWKRGPEYPHLSIGSFVVLSQELFNGPRTGTLRSWNLNCSFASIGLPHSSKHVGKGMFDNVLIEAGSPSPLNYTFPKPLSSRHHIFFITSLTNAEGLRSLSNRG